MVAASDDCPRAYCRKLGWPSKQRLAKFQAEAVELITSAQRVDKRYTPPAFRVV